MTPNEHCCEEVVEVSTRVDALDKEFERWRFDTASWRSNHERREKDSADAMMGAINRLGGALDAWQKQMTNRLPVWATMFIGASLGVNGALVGIIVGLSRR